jgi:uncharacterized membrane protein YdbT with pleckstrin-like domain
MVTLTGEMEKKLFRLADLRVQTADLRPTLDKKLEMAQLNTELVEFARCEMLDQIEDAVAERRTMEEEDLSC